jgi:hypothetical protein
VISFLLAKGISRSEINREVVAVYGANAMTFHGVSHWCHGFETGRMSVTNSPRSGRSSTSPTVQFWSKVTTTEKVLLAVDSSRILRSCK